MKLEMKKEERGFFTVNERISKREKRKGFRPKKSLED